MNRARLDVIRELVLSRAGEEVSSDGFKAICFVEVHVVRDVHDLLTQHDHIERVLFSFTSPTSTGCRRPALDNNDAAVSVVAGIDVQRVTNIGSMQMPAEDHVDP